MKASKFIFFLLVILLASCNGFASTPTTSPEMETAVAKLWTEYSETQTAITALTTTPTLSPTFVPPTAAPGNIPFPTPNSDQQVFVDPEGWYFVYLPSNLKKVASKPNHFSVTGEVQEWGLFFETGYLSKYGYMSNINNVCSWLANIDLQPPTNLAVSSFETYITHPYSTQCSAIAKSKSGNAEIVVEMDIYENPGADPDHRFIYLKRDTSSWDKESRFFFGWLKPINGARYIPNLEPISPKEMVLWKSVAPLLQSASVTEYELPPGGSDFYPGILVGDLPEEALPDWYKNPQPYPTPYPTLTAEEQLNSLGYERKPGQLFRDGRLLFDNVTGISKIYSFSSASTSITAFIVYTRGADGNPYNAFLIENDAIYKWKYNHQDPSFPPIFYRGILLWAKTTDDFRHIQILTSDQKLLYSFETYQEPMYSINRFTTWNDHWILAARDFLFQDGESINKKMGFEEIFSWRVINDKPAYLFRKGPRVGFFYDGKILPLEYQDVARYLCCEPAVDNPSIGEHEARFFGRRNGLWYYVIIKF